LGAVKFRGFKEKTVSCLLWERETFAGSQLVMDYIAQILKAVEASTQSMLQTQQ
jgi:hypothetical protein